MSDDERDNTKCNSFPVIYERKRPFLVDLIAAYAAGVASDATVQYSALALGGLGAYAELVISFWGKFVDRMLGIDATSHVEWLVELAIRSSLPLV